jgi:hypothetical protein
MVYAMEESRVKCIAVHAQTRVGGQLIVLCFVKTVSIPVADLIVSTISLATDILCQVSHPRGLTWYPVK